ncbi:two-component system response regulator [Alteromonas sp. ASW11-130]|uniref:two-component system response regulator n=1 Tax=Alteromonas sp. ASW11-130 TaxID=3015775 RepID=UPI00224291E0|nr:EAL domain-containing protein [Alteromonas sp. ASW11-130]MCW8090607.1 EAL domain-containing protein [Alteromonas sp. ASW11-130]
MKLIEKRRVLIVEDTTIAATYLARELSKLGADVVGLARSEDQAIEMTRAELPELILMDIHLADGSDGVETAEKITSQFAIPIIFTTSYSDDATVNRALKASPYGYIVKPFDTKTIKVTCETALHRFALEQKVVSSEKRFKVAAEAAQFGVVELDGKGKTFSFDGAQSLQNRFGAGTQMSREAFLALFPEHERGEIILTLEKRASLRKTIVLEGDESGRKYLDIVFSEVDFHNGDVIIGAVIDVTDKQRQIKQLRLSNIILDQLVEGVALLDQQFNIIDCNKALSTLLRIDISRLSHRDIFQFGLHASDLKDALNTSQIVRRKTILLTADGVEFPAFVTLSELEQQHEEIRYVATFSDITDLSKAERKLESLAFTDQLTGAGNRNYLKLILNEATYAHSIRALVFIDLDGFKLVNDTYGHNVGDELLSQCASRIRAVIRNEDTFIRHGGDEFVILVQEEGDLAQLGKRLLDVFAEPIEVSDTELKTSASIGIAEMEGTQEPENLLKHADIAMYEAKRKGKNQVVFFSGEQNDAIEYRLYVEQGLFNAIENKDLHARFQPIVDTENRVVALEALCRWRSQDIGDIHPESFIPIAEETGLINALGLKMLKEVCIASVTLRDAGLGDIKFHVNVSILQLNSKLMVSQFLEYLDDFDVKPEALVLEVTESAMHDIGTRKVLRKLAKSGFTIALDDFGAGYASVSELGESYTSIIKLDKSLAPGEDKSSQKNIIAESIIQLCRRLDKSILLEGIETQQQADFARHAGCHYMQGFHFSEPLTLTDVISFIQQD